MSPAKFCYVARREGEPGAYAACVDMAEHAKDTAKFTRDIIKEGGYVERVTVEDARMMLGQWYEWSQQKQGQGSLI